jgi:hypothetical protein
MKMVMLGEVEIGAEKREIELGVLRGRGLIDRRVLGHRKIYRRNNCS